MEDTYFQVGLHSVCPDTRKHLARLQAQEMPVHISQSQQDQECGKASKVSISDNDLLNLSPSTRALTSVLSSTVQKVRSQQRKDKKEKRRRIQKLRILILWFSHFFLFIGFLINVFLETNISSFIIMSYHKIYSSGFIFIHHQFRKRPRLPRLQWLCSLFSLFSAPRSFPGYSFRADDFPRRDRTRTIVLSWMMNRGASIWFSSQLSFYHTFPLNWYYLLLRLKKPSS